MKPDHSIDYPLYLLTAELENGLYWSEALFFPEVSRLAGRPPLAPLQGSLKKHMEPMTSLQLTYRQRPQRVKVQTFSVEVPPPKRSGAWSAPFCLQIFAVLHRLPLAGRLWAAHLPQLGLEVTAASPEELEREVAREVRGELQRRQILSRVVELILLQRWRKLRGKSVRLSLSDRTQSLEEKSESQLARLTRKMGGGPERAYEVEPALAQLAELLAEQNVLLVGPAGVGKSALLREFVRRRQEFRMGATAFYETSGSRLLFGEATFGGWQDRCARLIQELGKLKAILHLGNLQELLESARHRTQPYGVAGFLRPYLAAGKLQAVVEATPDQLAYVEREYPQFLESFTRLALEPAEARRTRAILAQRFPSVDPPGREAAAELHERFTSSSASPGWPVRFLNTVLRHHERPQRSHVVEAFSRQTGLPLLFLEDRIPFHRTEILDWFQQRLHGQEQAVERVVDRLGAFKSGLTRPQRPIASFLLIGPTGVGKTELARCLAEFVFQDRQRLTRLDMSEYSDPGSVRRLIGGDEMGVLVAKVRERPFQVLLFDEVEKAHPDFFDLLLQMLGDARLTDSASGRVADFSNCIILMTSNLGAASSLKGGLGFREQSQQGNFLEAVQAAFRPELINRIDEIIPFAPLSEATVLRICRQQLSLLESRDGLRNRPLELAVAPGVDAYLAQKGYDKRYGARPLQRTLDGLILAPLSQQLNAYPSQVKLKVSIEVTESGLLLSARPLNSLEKAAASEEKQRSLNERFSQLRRRYRKFEEGSVLTELRNERVRHQRSSKTVWPHQAFLERVAELGPPIEELEESALAALHEAALFEGLPERFQELQSQLQACLVEAYCLTYPQPHRVLVALYSEFPESLQQLTRAYVQWVGQQGWHVKLERVAVRKGNVLPKAPPLPDKLSQAHAQQPFSWTDQGWTRSPQLERLPIDSKALEGSAVLPSLGYLLEISGKNCLAWLSTEAGLHVHVHKGRERRVLVEVASARLHSGDPVSPFTPPAYEPPADIYRKGSIQHPVKVRTYQQDERVVQDGLGLQMALEGSAGWAEVLAALLKLCLERRAEEAVLQ